MMQKASLVPGVIYNLTFSNGFSYIRLLDEHAHIVLNLRCSVPDQCIYINDQDQAGAWGQRTQIGLPPEGKPNRFQLHLKIEQHLELWNAAHSQSFLRLSRDAAARVKYCILHGAQDDTGDILQTIPSVDEMSAQISTLVAMRRVDQLERQLASVSSNARAKVES